MDAERPVRATERLNGRLVTHALGLSTETLRRKDTRLANCSSLSRRCRRLRSASSLSASSTVKRALISSAFRSTLRDRLAEHPRSPGAGSSPADWLDRQAPIRFPSDTVALRGPDFVFAFHDGEEIGRVCCSHREADGTRSK